MYTRDALFAKSFVSTFYSGFSTGRLVQIVATCARG